MTDETDAADAAIARETAQAAADKARSDAGKAEAEAEKQRIDNAQAKAANALSLAATRLELELKSRNDADAQADRLVTRLTAALPKLSALPVGAVSFSDGAVFRGSELAQLAMDSAAEQLADGFRSAFPAGAPFRALVTSDEDLIASVVAYRELTAAIALLLSSAKTVHDSATDALATDDSRRLIGIDTAVTIATVAASALTEVATLFAADASVQSKDASASATVTRTLAIRALLQFSQGGSTVLDDSARVLETPSDLLVALSSLTSTATTLATDRSELAAVIASLAKATSAEHRSQRTAANGALAAVTAVGDQITAFLASISGTAGGAASALARALTRESIARAAGGVTHVVVVPPADITTDQVVQRSRIRRTRATVSASARVTYLLLKLDDNSILAAGTATGTAVRRAKFRLATMEWGPLAR
ncbi:hypothetical protein ACVXZ4_05775 [Lacisediminihabitans sp. FW035]